MSRSAHLGLLVHLATCRFCRRFNRQTRFIRSVFQDFHAHVEEASSLGLSTEAKDRIIARLQEQD